MKPIRVQLGERSYEVQVTTSFSSLPRLLRELRLAPWGCVVSHRSILARYGHDLLTPLRQAGWTIRTIIVPESERTKSYAMAARVLEQVAHAMPMRTPPLFAFGGGVVGDLTGFVAAVLRRGVPYVQVPTTLLAQVDSGLGGKVGVDLSFAKNLVGAIYQPRVVINHLGVLRSLPLRQRRSGLSEIVKYAMIADAPLFRFLETHREACLAGDLRVDRVMVERSCRIKARVVSQDEQDTRGIRAALNFGHTLGHALEAATGYRRFTHGEAIAVGMACAASLSVAIGRLSPAHANRLIAWLQAVGLPTRVSGVSRAALRSAFVHDKKFIHGTARWVLPVRIGRVIVTESVPTALMWRVINRHVNGS